MGSLDQTESFETASISLVRARQTVMEPIAVVYEITKKKKKGDAVRRLGTILAFAWPSGNGPVRVSCLKPFVAPFLPTRLTALGSPRMSSPRMTEQTLFF